MGPSVLVTFHDVTFTLWFYEALDSESLNGMVREINGTTFHFELGGLFREYGNRTSPDRHCEVDWNGGPMAILGVAAT
jgi:hypothetical protein